MSINADLLETVDPAAERRRLEAAIAGGDRAAETRYRLWELCAAGRDPAAARARLDEAIAIDPIRSHPGPGRAARRTILALAVPGDLQANLPLHLLLDAETRLHTLWIADPRAVIANAFRHVPPGIRGVDAVFIAIAQDRRHEAALVAADRLAAAIGLPVINSGAAIARQSRDAASERLSGIAGAVVPRQRAVGRAALAACPPQTPFIVRPDGSHAGHALARIDDHAELAAYLLRERARCFFVAPFVDFAGRDGAYRKCRIAFVGGRPYPVHLAIHDAWAVWYHNAHPDAFPALAGAEARFLDDMEGTLGPRATRALYDIASLTGLDYFGLDAALMPDGRLLLFKIETGLVVHAAGEPGSARLAAFRRVQRAMSRLLDRRIEAGGATGDARPRIDIRVPEASAA